MVDKLVRSQYSSPMRLERVEIRPVPDTSGLSDQIGALFEHYDVEGRISGERRTLKGPWEYLVFEPNPQRGRVVAILGEEMGDQGLTHASVIDGHILEFGNGSLKTTTVAVRPVMPGLTGFDCYNCYWTNSPPRIETYEPLKLFPADLDGIKWFGRNTDTGTSVAIFWNMTVIAGEGCPPFHGLILR